MKTTITRFVLAAAIAAAAAGAAEAQNMKANIPFTFRAGAAVLPAGDYRIDAMNANRVVVFYSDTTRKGAMVLPTGTTNPSKYWDSDSDPVLVFECTGSGRCSLTTLWYGGGAPAIAIPHRAATRDEHASFRFVHLTKSNGD